jgi:hypothetical protein
MAQKWREAFQLNKTCLSAQPRPFRDKPDAAVSGDFASDDSGLTLIGGDELRPRKRQGSQQLKPQAPRNFLKGTGFGRNDSECACVRLAAFDSQECMVSARLKGERAKKSRPCRTLGKPGEQQLLEIVVTLHPPALRLAYR